MRTSPRYDNVCYRPCLAEGPDLMFLNTERSKDQVYRSLIVMLVSVGFHILFWNYKSYLDFTNVTEAIPIKPLEFSLVSPLAPVSQVQPSSLPEPQKATKVPAKPKQAISKPKPVQKLKPPPDQESLTDAKSNSEVTPLKALSEPIASTANSKPAAQAGVTQRAEWRNAGLQNAPAKYPERARQMDWQGRVVLKVQVLPNGSAGSVLIAESSGHELLDDSALEAVRKWKFIPAKKDGIAVESYVNVPVNFKLKKEGE